MQWPKVVHPNSQKVPYLDPVLIVHEHSRSEFAASNEDLRLDAEALTDMDCRSNRGITRGSPIVRIGPFRHNDRHNHALEQVFGVHVVFYDPRIDEGIQRMTLFFIE